jgi:hypothetical protein
VTQRALSLDDRGHAVRYSIDTSALIDAYRVHYAPHVFRSVWVVLAELADNGIMCAPEEVLRELEARDDALLQWGKDHRAMFHPLDTAAQRRAQDILNQYPALVDPNSFGPVADPFVIALAATTGSAVVASEKATGTPGASAHSRRVQGSGDRLPRPR